MAADPSAYRLPASGSHKHSPHFEMNAETDPIPVSGWLDRRANGPMPDRAILFHAPSSVFQSPGGGECQLVQTGRGLESLGHVVRPFNCWTDRLRDARLLHLFGMSREGLELARLARSLKVPVVLSPICWIEPRALIALAANPLRIAGDLLKWSARRTSPIGLDWRSRLLNTCDLILPNSRAEAKQLVTLFGGDAGRIHVVPNGVEPRFAAADPGHFHDRYGDEPFVLYTGRIEPRKNVLGLVRAIKRCGLYRLTVIGDPVPGHEAYAAQCRREGRSRVRWLPRVDHDDPLLASAYAAARVFALPSWFETPGLAALEAALAGCPIVITPYGCTREYFDDLARYARPDRNAEIAAAIDDAWHAEPTRQLAEHVAGSFLWTESARITAEAYARIAT